MIPRLLNIQGIAGIAVGLALSILLVIQKGETRHWKKQSAHFEQLYAQEQSAFAATVASYRAAADQARAADRTNAARVASEQAAINERTMHDYQARLAAARTAAASLGSGRLQLDTQAAADPGAGGGASMPRLSTAPGGAAQAACQDRLPAPLSEGDALTATEQAIQLDELIRWVRRQHSVDPNAHGEARPQAVGQQAAVDNNPKAVASPPGD